MYCVDVTRESSIPKSGNNITGISAAIAIGTASVSHQTAINTATPAIFAAVAPVDE